MKIDFNQLETPAPLCGTKEHDEISKHPSFELPVARDVSSDLIIFCSVKSKFLAGNFL